MSMHEGVSPPCPKRDISEQCFDQNRSIIRSYTFRGPDNDSLNAVEKAVMLLLTQFAAHPRHGAGTFKILSGVNFCFD